MSSECKGAILLIVLFLAVGVAGTYIYSPKPAATHHGRGWIIDGNGNKREMTEEDWKAFDFTVEQFRRLQDEIRRQKNNQ